MSLCESSQASIRVLPSDDLLHIPGIAEPLSLALPPEIVKLRQEALQFHQEMGSYPVGLPEINISDARTWAAHTDQEDWLIWRARWCRERLASLSFDLEPGEQIVGKPHSRRLTPADQQAMQEADAALADMPPFPGGDPYHFNPDFEKLFRLGIRGMLTEVADYRAATRDDAAKQVFYQACEMVLDALSAFILRLSATCARMATQDSAHGADWRELAAICQRISTEPPSTFHEALQLLFATLIALWFGESHGLTTLGRLDQTLRSFYEADLAAGRITRRQAFEQLCCVYIHTNRILGISSAESVMVGGVDAQGRDVTNELTYLCLAARLATRLAYPTVGIAWHSGTPSELMDFAIEVMARGVGDPAFFNDEVISAGLRAQGVSEADSHNYMNSTCVEIKVVGRSHMWVTAPYINLPLALLQVLEGVESGQLPQPATYEAFAQAVRDNLAATIRAAAQQQDQTWRERPARGCFPLASCFILDCLARGQDFDRGGARYNWVMNSFVGLANLVDSLLAVRELVYNRRELTLTELQGILRDDFSGREDLRQRILHALPKYGNDEAAPDALAREWADFLMSSTQSNRVGPHAYVPGFFCWVMHEKMGSTTGATPDGRRAFWPLSDGAGGAQGRELHGPTASVLSTTTWSHQPAMGGLVHNIKFAPSVFHSAEGRAAVRHVIETYLQRGGFEIQVNVVDKETLLAARAHPEQYQDLLVRVAGYSDYFVKLAPKTQEEVIARTEHAL